jgi:hypothetical protein
MTGELTFFEIGVVDAAAALPPKRRKWPGRGYLPPEIECTPARFVCFQGSGGRESTGPQEIAIVWTGLHRRYRRKS